MYPWVHLTTSIFNSNCCKPVLYTRVYNQKFVSFVVKKVQTILNRKGYTKGKTKTALSAIFMLKNKNKIAKR
jgi:hypothetical protein